MKEEEKELEVLTVSAEAEAISLELCEGRPVKAQRRSEKRRKTETRD